MMRFVEFQKRCKAMQSNQRLCIASTKVKQTDTSYMAFSPSPQKVHQREDATGIWMENNHQSARHCLNKTPTHLF